MKVMIEAMPVSIALDATRSTNVDIPQVVCQKFMLKLSASRAKRERRIGPRLLWIQGTLSLYI